MPDANPSTSNPTLFPSNPIILSQAQRSRRTSGSLGAPRTNRFLPALRTAALAAILFLTLGATDPSHRYEKIGHEMICTCSCGQILLECNHVGCPVSGPMIDELHGQIATGASETSILNWFVVKYGAIVLAAPMRGGFDNVAWITPFAVFFLATIGTAITIRVWKLRSATGAGAPRLASETWVPTPKDAALRDRIRRETEY